MTTARGDEVQLRESVCRPDSHRASVIGGQKTCNLAPRWCSSGLLLAPTKANRFDSRIFARGNLSTPLHSTRNPANEEKIWAALNSEVLRADEVWIGIVMKGRGKREITEKTSRSTAWSGTIPTCENPVTRPRIEPGSPWWEMGRLTAQTPSVTVNGFNFCFGSVADRHSACDWPRDVRHMSRANEMLIRKAHACVKCGGEGEGVPKELSSSADHQHFNAAHSNSGIGTVDCRLILAEPKLKRHRGNEGKRGEYGAEGVVWPGIEPGSPRWETSRLTAQPQRPHLVLVLEPADNCCFFDDTDNNHSRQRVVESYNSQIVQEED
ncbi:hypothetical protein PR048_018829 [Dryococelus australis]|uniref:Uncharacterized protein n=1 Tax=Dryococelus australis TaxID=614101 RepID=A0ABQ9H1S7_9NEOP|nr:hypothetical protein PR048_018829 [Dryococelus australis]